MGDLLPPARLYNSLRMKKSGRKKEAYLGLDQGSTATKVLVVTPRGEVLHQARRSVATSESGPRVHQDPRAVVRSVRSALSESITFARERNVKIRGLGLATQRSSFLYFDRKGRALTPVISWRDTSGAGRIPSLDHHVKRIKKITGLPLTPYYSALKMMQHLPSRQNEILFGTVNTFLMFRLTGGKVFATDPANAQRTLLFNIRTLAFSEELLRFFSVPGNVRLPEVRDTAGHFGEVSVKGVSTPIVTSTGDQQAAFFGSSGWETGRGLINLGAGGFLLVPVTELPDRAKDLIMTLSHTDKGKPFLLLEGTVNAVSDALRYFESILGKRFTAGRLEQGSYPVIVFGQRGTGAPLWDPPFPAAVSGMGGDTGGDELLASSLFGSLCYFRLIDEAMGRSGFDAGEYVVSGGISAIEAVSRFLRDLLGKPVYRSMITEMTALGAALAAMVLGDGVPYPGKRKNFRLVRGKAPADAGAYYKEWLKLYRFARKRFCRAKPQTE